MESNKKQNTKLSKGLVSLAPEYRDLWPGSGYTCKIVVSGSGQDVKNVYANAMYQNDNWDGQLFTGYDKAILDAIYTIWINRDISAGNECQMSYLDIYRAMTGVHASQVSVNALQKIKDSVEKLRFMDIRLVVEEDTDRVRAYFQNTKKIKKMIIKEQALVATECSISFRNGTKTEGIVLYTCPILWKYAEAQAQIITIPEQWLAIPGNKTAKKISIRDYLICYIKGLQSEKANNNNEKLKYETILIGAGYPWPAERQYQAMERALVNGILDYYEEEEIIQEYLISKDLKYVTINV